MSASTCGMLHAACNLHGSPGGASCISTLHAPTPAIMQSTAWLTDDLSQHTPESLRTAHSALEAQQRARHEEEMAEYTAAFDAAKAVLQEEYAERYACLHGIVTAGATSPMSAGWITPCTSSCSHDSWCDGAWLATPCAMPAGGTRCMQSGV